VDSVRYYPILDLANRTFSLPDGGRLTFSGRIFGQETASTVYEAVLDSSAEGVCRLVAVKIRDHGEARDREESGITDSKGEIQIEGQRAVMMDAIPGKPGAP